MVAEYLEERDWRSDNPNGVRGRVAEAHRTLSTYLNTLAAAGFRLERLLEPPATGRRLAQAPGERGVPTLLLGRALALADP